MRKFKNLVATATLAAIMTLSVSTANAGFIITLRQAQPTATATDATTKEGTIRDLASIIKGGILVLEGILMSD